MPILATLLLSTFYHRPYKVFCALEHQLEGVNLCTYSKSQGTKKKKIAYASVRVVLLYTPFIGMVLNDVWFETTIYYCNKVSKITAVRIQLYWTVNWFWAKTCLHHKIMTGLRKIRFVQEPVSQCKTDTLKILLGGNKLLIC